MLGRLRTEEAKAPMQQSMALTPVCRWEAAKRGQPEVELALQIKVPML
jgi:hypothetical protein